MSDEIKIYRDAYADPDTCILMYKYKGKEPKTDGVFYCPYVSDNKNGIFRRILRLVTRSFRKTTKVEML